MTPASKIEQLAWLYCKEIGEDPDKEYLAYRGPFTGAAYRPQWQKHRDKAAAALEPIAMEAALRQLEATEVVSLHHDEILAKLEGWEI